MFKAAVFDLDGTLLNSNDFWHQLDHDFLEKWSLTPDDAYLHAVHHLDYAASAAFVVEHYGLSVSPQTIMNEWEAMAADAYTYHLPLKEGAKEVLETFSQAGIRMALVTLAPPILRDAALARCEIFSYFEEVLSIPLGVHKKKTPALYQTVCNRLDVLPSQSLGFEDALFALRAMRQAGVRSYAIADVRNIAIEASYVEEGFELHNWKDINTLINKKKL